jgi:hypothetical protein
MIDSGGERIAVVVLGEPGGTIEGEGRVARRPEDALAMEWS